MMYVDCNKLIPIFCNYVCFNNIYFKAITQTQKAKKRINTFLKARVLAFTLWSYMLDELVTGEPWFWRRRLYAPLSII